MSPSWRTKIQTPNGKTWGYTGDILVIYWWYIGDILVIYWWYTGLFIISIYWNYWNYCNNSIYWNRLKCNISIDFNMLKSLQYFNIFQYIEIGPYFNIFSNISIYWKVWKISIIFQYIEKAFFNISIIWIYWNISKSIVFQYISIYCNILKYCNNFNNLEAAGWLAGLAGWLRAAGCWLQTAGCGVLAAGWLQNQEDLAPEEYKPCIQAETN